MARCQICLKSKTAGNQISHSQIHTKREFKPNLQKVNGIVLCTRCLKTVKKGLGEVAVAAEAKTEAMPVEKTE